MFCKGNIIDASKAGLLKIVAYFINNGTNFNDVKKDGKFVYFNVYGVCFIRSLSATSRHSHLRSYGYFWVIIHPIHWLVYLSPE